MILRNFFVICVFGTPAEGVTLLDTTRLGLDEVIAAVIAMVPGSLG